MLIDPPAFRVNRFTSIVKLPSSAVLALNTHLLSKGHDVRILDCRNRFCFYEDIAKECGEFEPDVVGVTGYSSDAYSAMIVCEAVKKACPPALTVMGGYHASAVPELTLLTCAALDVVVVGEGERTLDDLLQLLDHSGGWASDDLAGIAGIVHRTGAGSARRSPPRPLIEDLDELAPFRYDNISPGFYQYPVRRQSAEKADGFLISASRGCTHACHYCSNQLLWRRTWRTFSPARIINEIRHLKEIHGKDTFFMCDNDFLTDPGRLKEFLDLLESSRLHIQWSIETSTAHVIRARDQLPRMRELGLFQCFVGFEFANATRLQRMGKGLASLERSREAARILRSHGIYVVGLGMIGLPDETSESIVEHVAFFRSLGADMVYTQCLTPLPGTRLFRDLLQAGQIRSFDFNDYDLMTPTLAYEHLTYEEMEELHVQASDALFTPGLSDLYEDYRMKRMTADELTRRYAAVAGVLKEYDDGSRKFRDVLSSYFNTIIERTTLPDIAWPAPQPLSQRDNARLLERIRVLDERATVMNPRGPGPASNEELMELANLITERFPRDALLKLVRVKRKKSDMLNLWLDMMCPEVEPETSQRVLDAERLWKRRSRTLLGIQNKVVTENPSYLTGHASKPY